MRRTSSRSAASKWLISSARERSTGSPYLRTCLSAASRRARVSGSSRSWGSTTSPCASSATKSILDGVDVHGEVDHLELPVTGDIRDRAPHCGDRGAALVGLEHELEAVTVAQPEQRRRAEQQRLRYLDLLRDGLGRGAGGLRVGGARHHADQVRERRIVVLLAAGELLAQEAVAVVVGGGEDRGRV